MSASRNVDSVAQQGEFRSRVPPSEPLTTKGRKPGVLVGNDAVPEFHAETYPRGTAPRENTFEPQPALEETPVNESAANDFPGATSGDVYNQTEFGKPMQGMTSREVRGEHAGTRKKERSGLEGVGATDRRADTVEGKVRQVGADRERDGEQEKAPREWQGAENVAPVRAEEIASEWR